MSASSCRLSRPGVVCSLGDDLDTIGRALFSGQRGLTTSDTYTPGRPLALGQVACELPDDSHWPKTIAAATTGCWRSPWLAWATNWKPCYPRCRATGSGWSSAAARRASVKPNWHWRRAAERGLCRRISPMRVRSWERRRASSRSVWASPAPATPCRRPAAPAPEHWPAPGACSRVASAMR